MSRSTDLTVPFRQLRSNQVALAGGKCSSLGELMAAGLQVPNGFAITTHAYRLFIEESGLHAPIAALLDGLDVHDTEQLAERAGQIRELILEAEMPQVLARRIQRDYEELGSGNVSVRSSTSVEDGAEASFAGQQDTHLYIRGVDAVISTVQMCFASLWTDRALLYSTTKGFNHLEVAMAVGIQNMVSADRGAAGVMFTIEPDTGHPGFLAIEGLYGLGDTIVSGGATPDGWLVSKFGFNNGGRAVVQHTLGSKEIRTVRDETGTRQEPVPDELRTRFCLTDDQVLQIAGSGMLIEEHYGRPMDVEWAFDGEGQLWILQARPETVASKTTELRTFAFTRTPNSQVLATGTPVGNMIATGRIRILTEPDPAAMAAFQEGDGLVTFETTPVWLPVMRKAAFIITKRGGRTSHAAIVAREQGVPAVVGVGDDFDTLTDGTLVTVSCADGKGVVYEGAHPFNVTIIDPKSLPTTETRVMFNLADPSLALERSQLPHKGVGLLRAELIIAEISGIHPMALLMHPHLDDPAVVTEITRRTAGFVNPADFFVTKLAEGIAMIAAAFAPYPVIFRLSDFKTNEYRELLGGSQFEGVEENPMLGFRGAGRYTDPRYAAAFALECEAVRRVRNDMGLTNLKVMVPFIRTPEEAIRVLETMADNGIGQDDNGLEVYAMIEVPSNAIRAAELAALFDGFSIGSNDLTQLILGVDRDSGDPSLVAVFNEMNPAVLWAMEQAIDAAREEGIPCGICGQGPSDRPELAAWLVSRGISSISVLPDAVVQTLEVVASIEGAREGARVVTRGLPM